MPYVKQEERVKLDKVVNLMKSLEIKADGDLNYILFAYCKRHVPENYNSLKNFCGELNQCATEIERKILGPYEDTKECKNGKIT